MNAILATLSTQITSARNAMRDESRMKVAAVVMLLVDVGLMLWGVSQLRMSVQRWQIQGVLAQHVLQLCLFSYVGVAVLTVVGSLQRMLDSDEALVLFTLPLTSATRFRTLYSTILVGNMWSWMLLEAIVSGYAFFPSLGWQTLLWIVLLELGAMFAVLCAIIGVLCSIRYLLSKRSWTRWIWSGLMLFTIAIAAYFIVLTTHRYWLLITINLLHPELYIVIFGITLLLALGPFANICGSLYVQAFLVTQHWDRSHHLFTLPGIRMMVNILAKRRTLMSALCTKMLLNQNRNPFAWLRIGVIVLVLALFTPLHSLALRVGWSNTLFVVVYAAALGVVPVVEQAPCAISGEANRLTLYMVAPFDISSLLRVRLLQFLLPSASIGFIVSLVYSWQLHLTFEQLTTVMSAMVLLVTGIMMVMVWGSVWDEDMNLAVEGVLQALMQEEGPITPRRMGLFNMGLATFVSMVIVLWKVPMLEALPALGLIDGVLMLVLGRLGCAKLRRLVV